MQVELTVLGATACFGERALIIADESRSATCTARGETKCLRLTRAKFQQILGSMLNVMFPEVSTRHFA